MKKVLIIVALAILSAANAYALPGFDIGIFGGLSTPNDKIPNVYTLKDKNVGSMVFDGAMSGFHIGAKVRIGLSDNLSFVGSLAWHHLPETQTIYTSNLQTQTFAAKLLFAPEDIPALYSKQEIIPFTVGLNYKFLNAKVVSGYFVGDLAYNYFSNKLDVPAAVDAFVSASKTYGRVGAGLGAGFDLNLIVMKIGLEGKYNFTNLIGKEDGEDAKNFFSLSLCFYL